MASKKFLDQGGVSHLWSKIKQYLDNRFGIGTISNTGIIMNTGSIVNMGAITCSGTVAVNNNTKIEAGMPMELKPAEGLTSNRLKYEIGAAHGIAVLHKGSATSNSIKGYNIVNSYTETVYFTAIMFVGSSSNGSLNAHCGTLSPGADESYETNTPLVDMHQLLIFW